RDYGDSGRDRDQQARSPRRKDDAERGALDPVPRQGPGVATADRYDGGHARRERPRALGEDRGPSSVPRRRGTARAAPPPEPRPGGLRRRVGAGGGASRTGGRGRRRAAAPARRGSESGARPAHGGSRDHGEGL